MPGLVINKQIELVPGLDIKSWHDDPALRIVMGEDGRPRRTQSVNGIVLHTTKGIPGGKDRRPQLIKPGLGPNVNAEERVARYWSSTDRQAGAHIVIDFDGSIGCLADLQTEVTYHAGNANEVTVGIEIYQGNDAELYEGQLEATVLLIDYLTRRLGIQRQIQKIYHGKPIPRLATCKDAIGVYGHRDISNNRGEGDPGNAIFDYLRKAGYLLLDYAQDEDLAVWRDMQMVLNKRGEKLKVDGVAGPTTVAAMERAGYRHGILVQRPGD